MKNKKNIVALLILVISISSLNSCSPKLIGAITESQKRDLYFNWTNSSMLAEDSLPPNTFIQFLDKNQSTGGLLEEWKIIMVEYSSVLGNLGYGTGPFEFRYTSKEMKAIKKFQNDNLIPVSGTIDSITSLYLLRAKLSMQQQWLFIQPQQYLTKTDSSYLFVGFWHDSTIKPVNSITIENIYTNLRNNTFDIVSFIYDMSTKHGDYRDYRGSIFMTRQQYVITQKDSLIKAAYTGNKIFKEITIDTSNTLVHMISYDSTGHNVKTSKFKLRDIMPYRDLCEFFYVVKDSTFKNIESEIFKDKVYFDVLRKKNMRKYRIIMCL